MAKAMLLAVVFAALASGARYMDYAGVKMPEYGGASADYEGPRDVVAMPSDEYRDHSPDAPAPLDYKYEEDPVGQSDKSVTSNLNERDVDGHEAWQNVEKDKTWPVDENLESLYKYNSQEIVPKFKPINRLSKHGSRLKAKTFETETDIIYSPTKYSRKRNEESSELESVDDVNVNREKLRDHNKFRFEGKNTHRTYRGTTKRVKKARRMPRDKYVKSQSEDDTVYNGEDLFRVRGLNKKDRKETDYVSEDERRRPNSAELGRSIPQRYNPSVDDIDDIKMKLGKMKSKNYGEYDDYYDMKRVNSIKSKLPTLLRRPSKTRLLGPPPPPPMVPTPTTQDTTSSWNVWSHRRANLAHDSDDSQWITTTASSSTTTTSAPTIKTTQASPVVNSDLSLAEMSRLSILKKALRKDSISNTSSSTKKPPVLLQLATKIQTVVMVEPPSSQKPLLRMQEVSGDSPDRLDHVKRLMRRKLVSNARNIQELTDNWDDMVCDYIDMSLLDNSATTKCISSILVALPMLLRLAREI